MIYIANLLLIFLWNVLLKPKNEKRKKIFLVLSFIQLFLLSTFRNYTVGYDSYNYYNLYLLFPKVDWSTAIKRSEIGYVAINRFAYWIGGENYWVLWGICALLVLLPFFYFIYLYSDNVFYSVCIYICFGYYYNSMNQIRQMISVSICLLAFIALNEKKYIRAFIIIMMALSFHNSALVFLGLLFVRLFLKYINRWLILFSSIILLVVYLNFKEVLEFVRKYYDVFSVYFTNDSKSVHLTAGFSLYIFIYLPVLFIVLWTMIKDHSFIKKNSILKLQLLAIILAEFILIISINMHIINRFALYFEIYTCTLLPNAYLVFSKGRYRQLLNVVSVMALLFIHHYYLFIAENHGGRAGIIPYVLFNKLGGL